MTDWVSAHMIQWEVDRLSLKTITTEAHSIIFTLDIKVIVNRANLESNSALRSGRWKQLGANPAVQCCIDCHKANCLSSLRHDGKKQGNEFKLRII